MLFILKNAKATYYNVIHFVEKFIGWNWTITEWVRSTTDCPTIQPDAPMMGYLTDYELFIFIYISSFCKYGHNKITIRSSLIWMINRE